MPSASYTSINWTYHSRWADHVVQAVEGAWQLEGDAAADLRNRLLWSGCDIVYVVGGFMRRAEEMGVQAHFDPTAYKLGQVNGRVKSLARAQSADIVATATPL